MKLFCSPVIKTSKYCNDSDVTDNHSRKENLYIDCLDGIRRCRPFEGIKMRAVAAKIASGRFCKATAYIFRVYSFISQQALF